MAYHQLILSLGGNLGDKAEIFEETSDWIDKLIGKTTLRSPIYETPPWGFMSDNNFWNQVLAVETNLGPMEVLQKIRAIENHFGRKRKDGNYLSRKMDIDILFYDNEIIKTEELTIPHPMMELRRFVLVPLADILPDHTHPVTGKKMAEMLSECRDNSEVTTISL